MSKFQLIDLPVRKDITSYERAIIKATELLSALPELLSVYQIGGVSAPGISDIDLVVVFKNGSSSGFSLHEQLGPEEKYLFVHRVYGITEEQLLNPITLTFFHSARLLFGRDVISGVKKELEGKDILKKQIAYEFLLKMWMVMSTQRQYEILKVRAFLLEAHAIKYDLEFLGIKAGKLADAVQDVIKLRSQWFDLEGREEVISELLERMYIAITEALVQGAQNQEIFLPEKLSLKMSNMTIHNGETYSVKRKGILLPSVFTGKKQFNLLHRFNRFHFTVPYNLREMPMVIANRFAFVNELRNYNLVHLPDFLPLVSSLKFDE